MADKRQLQKQKQHQQHRKYNTYQDISIIEFSNRSCRTTNGRFNDVI